MSNLFDLKNFFEGRTELPIQPQKPQLDLFGAQIFQQKIAPEDGYVEDELIGDEVKELTDYRFLDHQEPSQENITNLHVDEISPYPEDNYEQVS